MLERLTQEQTDKLNAFAELLCEANRTMNLTRITDAAEIKVRHFEDSLVILDQLGEMEAGIDGRPTLMDIGSGAGFPAIPLAIALSNWKIVSVESTGKKVEFQQTVAGELELANLTVLQTRAEKLGQVQAYREKYDAVVARAVGHMAMIVELSLPFLKIGGKLYAWKGPKLTEELKQANNTSRAAGGSAITETPYNLPGIEDSSFRIAVVEKLRKTPAKYPREYKIIKQELQ